MCIPPCLHPNAPSSSCFCLLHSSTTSARVFRPPNPTSLRLCRRERECGRVGLRERVGGGSSLKLERNKEKKKHLSNAVTRRSTTVFLLLMRTEQVVNAFARQQYCTRRRHRPSLSSQKTPGLERLRRMRGYRSVGRRRAGTTLGAKACVMVCWDINSYRVLTFSFYPFRPFRDPATTRRGGAARRGTAQSRGRLLARNRNGNMKLQF